MTNAQRVPLTLLVAGLAGCGTLSTGPGLGQDASGDGIKAIVPNKTLNLAPSAQIPLEALVVGAAIFWYVDPLAPNWQVAEQRVSQDTFRIDLRRKPIVSGGDGEAHQLFERRAGQLARDYGKGHYEVMEYTSGIESTLPFSRRIASGTVRVF